MSDIASSSALLSRHRASVMLVARCRTWLLSAFLCGCAAEMDSSTESVNLADPPTEAPVIVLDAGALAAAVTDPELHVWERVTTIARWRYVGDTVVRGHSTSRLERRIYHVSQQSSSPTGATSHTFGRRAGVHMGTARADPIRRVDEGLASFGPAIHPMRTGQLLHA